MADHPDLPDDPSGDDGGSGLPPEIEQLIARLTGGPVDPQMAKAFKDMNEKERTELAKNNPAEYHRQLDALKAESKTNY